MSDAHEPTLAEQDNPKLLIIIGAMVVTVLVVVALVIGVDQFYKFSIQDAVSTQQGAIVDSRLPKLREREKHDLHSYQWLDKDKGVVRIPVDDAVRLTLEDWPSRPAGVVPAAGAAPAPAPGPATGATPEGQSAPANAPNPAQGGAAPTPAPAPSPAGTPAPK